MTIPKKIARLQNLAKQLKRLYITIATAKRTPNDPHTSIVILNEEQSLKKQRCWFITSLPHGYEVKYEDIGMDAGTAARMVQSLHRVGWIPSDTETQFLDLMEGATGQFEKRRLEVLLGGLARLGLSGSVRKARDLLWEVRAAPCEPGGELYGQRDRSRSRSLVGAQVGYEGDSDQEGLTPSEARVAFDSGQETVSGLDVEAEPKNTDQWYCHELICCESKECREHDTCCEGEDCNEETLLPCCQRLSV